jgi:hypothetical protein
MPFEYSLVPKDGERAFPAEMVEGMRRYLSELPSHRWNDDSFVLFSTLEDRDRRVPYLLANRGENNYLDPFIYVSAKEVLLSVVGNPDVDRYVYDFVVWCQRHWPCDLYYVSQVVPPEELLAEA